MLELSKKYLEDKGAFTLEQSSIIGQVASTIPFATVPEKMRLTIAASEIITFASQFRRNILHWDNTSVPINSISMILTASGKNKDSSVRAVRKCFKSSYDIMDAHRDQLAIQEAKLQASEQGSEDFKPFYDILKPAPIFISPTTEAGLVNHINELSRYPIGAGLLYSGEFGDELATSMDMLDNIKTLSEVFDLGEKEVKFTKGREFRSEEIKGQPVSALLVSSPTFILYDDAVKRKFQIAFMSKLARRCNFCFVHESLKEPTFTSMEEAFEFARSNKTSTLDLQQAIASELEKVTNYQISVGNTPIGVDSSVEDLFTAYRIYNTEVADNVLPPSSISALVRAHLQWKALKLAGALAILSCSDTIQESHYIEAINFYEMIAPDMDLFESELNKLPYERFADYIQTCVDPITGKASIDIHNLKKKGYIATTANPKVRLKELIAPAAVYDKLGLYTVSDDGLYIHYERIHKTDTVTVSVKPIDNSRLFKAIATGADHATISDIKSRIAATATYGFESETVTFADLADLLQGNYAYSPFLFKDGVRGKSNIKGGTKWLALDIDSSVIKADEAHFMLSDINHHIALGSDATNPFKFRILIELDSIVDVSPIVWRNFYQCISSDLGLNVDPLPQSQIFFSYWEDGRTIYSVTDASPIPVRDYLMQANDMTENAPSVTAKTLSQSQRNALLSDELTTFAPAFNAQPGEGSRKLIWAANYAYRDLGLSKEDTISLLERINDYWLYPIPEERFDKTIRQQVQRW